MLLLRGRSKRKHKYLMFMDMHLSKLRCNNNRGTNDNVSMNKSTRVIELQT